MILTLPCGRQSLIDDADTPLLKGRHWHSEARGRVIYVRGRLPGQRGGGVYLHNLIMGGRADHRNGDGLNNQRSNLRLCTQAQNGLNRAPKAGKRFKGVYRRASGSYYAQVSLNGVTRSRGGFATEEAAALAHDEMAIEMHGQWARLSFSRGETVLRMLDRGDDARQETLL